MYNTSLYITSVPCNSDIGVYDVEVVIIAANVDEQGTELVSEPSKSKSFAVCMDNSK